MQNVNFHKEWLSFFYEGTFMQGEHFRQFVMHGLQTPLLDVVSKSQYPE